MINRRKIQRISCKETVSLQITLPEPPHKTGRIVQIESIDISASGLQLHLQENLIEHCILDLCIEMKTDNKLFLLTTEVRWCKQNKQGTYDAGIQILEAENTDFAHWIDYIESN